MNKTLTVLSWLAFLCGAITYFIAWIALLSQSIVWGIGTEFWFYDSIAAILIGIFLVMVNKRSIN